jgi:hypothetical protein
MLITNKAISRRAVLKGVGVTMALPLLEAMVPARTIFAQGASAKKLRFVAIEMVHGAAGSAPIGAQKHLWSPAGHRQRVRPQPELARDRSNRSATTSPSSATPTCGTPRRSRRRRSAAITSARARCS